MVFVLAVLCAAAGVRSFAGADGVRLLLTAYVISALMPAVDVTTAGLGVRMVRGPLPEAVTRPIEGVLVVNEQGRVQLVNGAARRMLKLTGEPDDHHYLEIVRHPEIAAQIGAALAGTATDDKAVGSVATELVGGQTKTFRIALKRSTRIALAKDGDKTLPTPMPKVEGVQQVL